jgi:hypothetical protein
MYLSRAVHCSTEFETFLNVTACCLEISSLEFHYREILKSSGHAKAIIHGAKSRKRFFRVRFGARISLS